MPRRFFLLLLPILVLPLLSRIRPHAAVRPVVLPGPTSAGSALLPNGWKVTPAGHLLPLPGDLPLRLVITPDGKSLVVNTGGFHDQSVSVFDLATERVTQSVNVGKDWNGLCLSPAGDTVYVSGGGAPSSAFLDEAKASGVAPALLATFHTPVLRFGLSQGTLHPLTGLDVAGLDENHRFISGLASDRKGTLFVIDMPGNSVYKLSGRPLTTQGFVGVGDRPAAIAVSPDGSVVAVANEGDRSVTLLNADTLDTIAHVSVGPQPCDLVYGKDGRLFVACAGSNSVSVIVGTFVIETIRTTLPSSDLVGSTPDALALAPDETRLYVANAGNNAIAVVDVSVPAQSQILGFIPTAWYPTALALAPDGKTLYIGTAKGLASRANVPALAPAPRTDPGSKQPYDAIGSILSGSLAVVPVLDQKALDADTQRVLANTPTARTAFVGRDARTADEAFAAFRHITHVLYIIRENRTYDQVLGDMGRGNGDPALTRFGRSVTPNAHALAQHMVLLDNLYGNGEVSEDGHPWCDSAYATDFTERAWPGNASGRGEPEADDALTTSPAGSLWNACAHHGISFYSYGEAATFLSSPNGPPLFTGAKGLAGHASAAWSAVGIDRHDTERAAVFLADLKQAERTGVWPQFMVMSLPEDQTQGLEAGKYTPVAHVAANDQALGQIVQGVSRSRFWKNTAIFVIEDAAQDGADHVDAHRTVGLVLSPYVRRGVIDSTFYTTASFVRTMELILKLPPLTQYDQAATPLLAAFTPTPNFTPLPLLPPRVSFETRNPATGPDAR